MALRQSLNSGPPATPMSTMTKAHNEEDSDDLSQACNPPPSALRAPPAKKRKLETSVNSNQTHDTPALSDWNINEPIKASATCHLDSHREFYLDLHEPPKVADSELERFYEEFQAKLKTEESKQRHQIADFERETSNLVDVISGKKERIERLKLQITYWKGSMEEDEVNLRVRMNTNKEMEEEFEVYQARREEELRTCEKWYCAALGERAVHRQREQREQATQRQWAALPLELQEEALELASLQARDARQLATQASDSCVEAGLPPGDIDTTPPHDSIGEQSINDDGKLPTAEAETMIELTSVLPPA
ncbi:hypothetical protein AMS68_004789 [Peltaster fructicola]|uniref:Uncharacterized protein n=1 Tax=Peltaster fructicola TaxID=286661 RepID=A0A6H0XWX3_9PEZI|nr:hypothetical protein AMS68_004789 [Peltaster fructicola]